jgi:hypothetical protein
MNRTFTLVCLLLLFLIPFSFAQTLTQTIRGQIADKETRTPLPGATIRVLNDSTGRLAAAADQNGAFRIDGIKVGRYALRITFLGYQQVDFPNVVVTSGKEVILNVEMETSAIEMTEVVISGGTKSETLNEMATVSARTFSVEETGRYAGSRADPARMASNFAGVQGSNDSRNDIVVRGNSPIGVLYRMEGVSIPNPNHFAIAGTTGGPVSIINNKALATSDFFTGAFPGEYGNAIAGVFDLNLRSGNNEKHEFTGQLGVLGTEIMAEGPISKTNKSSYLFAYRYSTLRVFQALNIKFGTSAVPNYQDLTFKLNFPAKKLGTFSVFGIGGASKIDIVVSKNKDLQEDIYADKDRDQYFRSQMGVLGASHWYTVNPSTFIRTTFTTSYTRSRVHHNLVYMNTNFELDSLRQNLGYNFREIKQTLASSLTKKIGVQHTLKTGFYIDHYGFTFVDSVLNEQTNRFENRWYYTGNAFLIQPYAQWKYKPNDQLTFTAGLNGLIFTLNTNSKAIEPRAGISWRFKGNQSLSVGYGLHHQMQPTYIYFYHLPVTLQPHNLQMGFTRSQHWVLSYDHALSPSVRIKAETYYQQLDKIPVTRCPSSFSLLNQGSGFDRFFPDSILVNTGTGRNYGVEFTLEKFFSHNYFLLFTGSLYDSKYRGSDGVLRDTDFNGNFAANLLSGAEWQVGKKKQTTLLAGGKITWAGGRRYSPVDAAASLRTKEVVAIDSLRNSLQFRDYFRLDFRIGFRRNSHKLTHEVAVDLVNVLGVKNVLSITYAPNPKQPGESPFREEYQLGFLPLFYYKLDF